MTNLVTTGISFAGVDCGFSGLPDRVEHRATHAALSSWNNRGRLRSKWVAENFCGGEFDHLHNTATEITLYPGEP